MKLEVQLLTIVPSHMQIKVGCRYSFRLKLSFEDHINNDCQKASQKLNSLARIVNATNIYFLIL